MEIKKLIKMEKKLQKELQEEIDKLKISNAVKEACKEDGVCYMRGLRFFTVYTRIFDELFYQGYNDKLHYINLEIFMLPEGEDCKNMVNVSSDTYLFLDDDTFYYRLHKRAIKSIKYKKLYLCQVCESVSFANSYDVVLMVDV